MRAHPQTLRFACIAASVVLVGALFILGAQPFAVGLFRAPWDKVAHFALFGVLGGLFAVAAGVRRPWLGWLLVCAVAVADEWHQVFLPGRAADPADLAADLLAAALAAAIAWGVAGRRSPPV